LAIPQREGCDPGPGGHTISEGAPEDHQGDDSNTYTCPGDSALNVQEVPRSSSRHQEDETTRTHFAFRIDRWERWNAAGDNIIDHIAGIEDYQVARAAYEAAMLRWPGEVVTLRQGARVVLDSRRTRLA
jgi:hypothetical protein